MRYTKTEAISIIGGSLVNDTWSWGCLLPNGIPFFIGWQKDYDAKQRSVNLLNAEDYETGGQGFIERKRHIDQLLLHGTGYMFIAEQGKRRRGRLMKTYIKMVNPYDVWRITMILAETIPGHPDWRKIDVVVERDPEYHNNTRAKARAEGIPE